MTGPGAHERPQQGTEAIPRGTIVRDLDTDRVGVLMDVIDYTSPALPGPDAQCPGRRLAFIRPVGGGREWTTHLLTRSQTIQVTRPHDVRTGHHTP
jgi:hypothetical protein